ncbi:hypothetical protein [Sphingomonas sp. Leaf17]|uniref:hypothetical protein n=1 Tax=Sphingomonas sp. Leaf17 TaxID=1735683 RepID=UPI0012E2B7E3|nr:hypothetical protein [Sphingomonas sp. Leaf17]
MDDDDPPVMAGDDRLQSAVQLSLCGHGFAHPEIPTSRRHRPWTRHALSYYPRLDGSRRTERGRSAMSIVPVVAGGITVHLIP